VHSIWGLLYYLLRGGYNHFAHLPRVHLSLGLFYIIWWWRAFLEECPYLFDLARIIIILKKVVVVAHTPRAHLFKDYFIIILLGQCGPIAHFSKEHLCT
jgi:hypothetical protein